MKLEDAALLGLKFFENGLFLDKKYLDLIFFDKSNNNNSYIHNHNFK